MEAWEKTLAELKEQYIRGSGKRLDKIARNLDLLQLNPDDRATLQELQRYFHGLSGSGTTYGFPHISSLGVRGEQHVDRLLRANASPKNTDLKAWKSLLEDLRAEFKRSIVEPASPAPAADPVEETAKPPVKSYEIL